MRDVIPSPNIWRRPDVYELENLGADPDGVIEATMRRHHDWSGATVLDIGCGTGFHLARFAAEAARVIGVEPHRPLVRRAHHRLEQLPAQLSSPVSLRHGTAQHLPVAPSSVDVAHARWKHTDRASFEAVVRIEFDWRIADAFLAEHPGTTVDYAVNLFWRQY